MLILSRKEDQKVRFPDLGITIQVLKINQSSIRLGMEAPREIRIVRDEIPYDLSENRQHQISLPAQQRHELRNQLNSLSIAIHLFREEVAAGCYDDAETTFENLVDKLDSIVGSSVLKSPRANVVKSDSSQQTVLLIEDEPNEREMLAGFLRLRGYQIATSCDGIEAMEYLQANDRPVMVLVDMHMPRCDGPTLIRRLRENPKFKDLQIFGLSGSTPEENHLDTDKGVINGWFMKPLNPSKLVSAMTNIAS